MEITGIAVELALARTTRFVASVPGAGGGRESWPEGTVRVGPLEVGVAAMPSGSGRTFALTLRNPGRGHAVIRRVGFRLSASPRLVLETGYQSWSPIRRCAPGDVRPLRRVHPLMARGCFHADPGGAGRVVAGDQYLVWAGAGTGGTKTGTDEAGGAACFLRAENHLSTIEATGEVWAWALMDRVVLEPGTERALDPLWAAEGDPGALYSELAALWGKTSGARGDRPSAAPPGTPGWCSWYQYWWKVKPDDIRHNLMQARQKGIGLFVLDDGYQRAVGDWLAFTEQWSQPGSTPRDIAGEIAAAGMVPGIWTAPFFAGRLSRVATAHPEWIVRAARGAYPLGAVYNPVSWGGWVDALDTTQPAVLEHLRTTYSELAGAGYRFFKIDFCYGATMPGRRYGDGRVTRAQSLRAGLEAVRDGIGEDAYLLGCGCPFGPAVGVVDAMRVSPDTAPWWNPTLLKWPGYPDTAPAAVNAVRASVLRAPLHRRLFVNDPDCALLRPVKSRLSDTQRRMIADTVGGTGGFALLSDDLATYRDEEWAMVAGMGSPGAGLDSPLDIADPFSKAVTVRSAAAELQIDWGEPSGIPLNPPGWRWDGTGSGAGGGGEPGPWSRLAALTPRQ